MILLLTQIKRTFFLFLAKIFARLLSVKKDDIEKITNIILISLSKVVKIWSEQNQFQKE